MIVGSILEFILGNTFPFVVFGTFGSFWLSLGATLVPYFNAFGAYSKDPSIPSEGLMSPTFLSSFAYFQLYMGVLCFIYLIVSVRTNVCFFMIFLLLVPAFGCLAGYFWNAALGSTSTTLLLSAGALTFVVCLLGWYLFLVQLLAAVDFPLNLPVGDMSGLIKGASERQKEE